MLRASVIVFPGSNCDRDMAVALETVTGKAPAMVWHRESELPDGVDFIALPGVVVGVVRQEAGRA